MMTENAKAFIAANKRSPVVSGSAVEGGGKGGSYTLRSGKTFFLTVEESKAVGMPRWHLPA